MQTKLHKLRYLLLPLLWIDLDSNVGAQTVDAFLDNTTVKVGVNSGTYGGAIVWLSGSDGANLVNIYDKGREIQQSYYAGKSITAANQSSSWTPWPWNPIMVGDYAGHVSPVPVLNKSSGQIYVKTQPMLWDRNNQVSQSYMEQWISLHPTLNNVVVVDCRLTCFRDTNDAWGAPVLRDQELPAVYFVSALNTIKAYTGSSPWTAGTLATIPNSPASGTFPWSRYIPTEPWTACVDSTNSGAGVYTPSATSFLAGKAGTASSRSPTDSSTMYIAPLARHALGYNTILGYRFYLLVGSLTTMRESVYTLRSQAATAPLPPTGLVATAGSEQIGLTWNPSANANSYNIKRSSNSGGPFACIASGTETHYTDTGLANGVQYFYTVSSSGTVGEGADSPSVAATAADIIAVPNSGFEAPVIATYQYNPSAPGSWTFNSGSGLSRNASAFTFGNPPAPEGTQVAFIQGRGGSVSQMLGGFTPGTNYRISFGGAQRSGYAGQTWDVTINGNVIGSFAPPPSATSYSDYSAIFTASSASHLLAFVGTNLNGGDNTVFIDNVRVTSFAETPTNPFDYTWDGTANLWSSAHWLPGPVAGPTGSSSSTSVCIPSGTVTFAVSDTMGEAATTSSPVLTIHGGTLASGGKFNTLWDVQMVGGTLLANGGVNATFGAFQLAGTLSVTGTCLIDLGSGSYNTVNLGGVGNDTLTISTSGVSDTLTINPVLQNRGANVSNMNKSGPGTLTLNATNTYTGATTISGGTLALGAGGAINTTTAVDIADGATFDVSAITSYTLGSSSTLKAAGSATAATLKGKTGGTVSLGSRPITLIYDGSHPALTVSQGALSLNGNAFTVNGSALSVGTYTLVSQASGPITTEGTYPDATGTAIASNKKGTIAVVGNTVVLTVTANLASWINGFFPGETNSDIIGPPADPDKDGLTNAEEYAFGLLPHRSTSCDPITVQLDKTAGTFSYTRTATPATTGITYTVWTSTSLAASGQAGGWTQDTGASEGAITTAGGIQTVPVTLSGTKPLAGSVLFVRVKAVVPAE